MLQTHRATAAKPARQGRRTYTHPASTRAKVTNKPLSRANGNTSSGRRVRDLFRAYLAAVGNPASDVIKAQVLAAAELVTAAENARTQLLADPTMDIEQIIRLENLANRAVRRLGIKPVEKQRLSMRDQLIAEAEGATNDT